MNTQRYKYNKYIGDRKYTDKPAGSLINMSDLERDDAGELLQFPYTLAGDYTGSKVERSNTLFLAEEFKDVEGVYEAVGGYNSSMIVIRESLIIEGSKDFNKEAREAFDAIIAYPLLCDDLYYQLQLEAEAGAWDYLDVDLLDALEEAGIIEDAGIIEEDDSRMGEIKARFYEIMNSGQVNWLHEDINTPWVDMEEVAATW